MEKPKNVSEPEPVVLQLQEVTEQTISMAAETTKEEAEAAVEAAKAKEEALREQLENLGEDDPEREKLLAELEEAQNKAEFAGGMILILIGLKILLEGLGVL